MSAPFYNNIKGTTGSSPGTGAFTPNAAVTGALAWSNVHTGWMGLVRYDDGTSWELRYGYWDGTTISRPTNGFVSSSSGSGLSLGASATATLVIDGTDIQPRIAGDVRASIPATENTTPANVGLSVTASGTAAGVAVAATSYLTEQVRVQYTSATTANARAGVTLGTPGTPIAVTSSTAGRGGWSFNARFGVSQLPTGPRLFVGMTDSSYAGVTTDPSALVADYAGFAKDAADTNIQLLVNSAVSTGTKTDTGIPLVVNAWYDASLWSLPGSLTVYALLMRRDTGDLWYGSTATDVPVSGSLMQANLIGALSGTTGTAIIVHYGGISVRTGGM